MNVKEYHDLLGKTKKPRKQLEGLHQKKLGDLLNGTLKAKISPCLIFWTYSASGEKKPIKTAVLQKRKGLKRGDFDYRFEIREGSFLRMVYLETKTTSGSLTTEQKQFMKKKEGLTNASCYTSKSIEESIKILEDERILLT
jgi:hypothetical protein